MIKYEPGALFEFITIRKIENEVSVDIEMRAKILREMDLRMNTEFTRAHRDKSTVNHEAAVIWQIYVFAYDLTNGFC